MHDDEAAGYWNLGSRDIEEYPQEALHSLEISSPFCTDFV